MKPRAAIMLLAAACLASCASVADAPPAKTASTIDLSGVTLSDFVIPNALPDPDDPLGALRPDAEPVRDDVEIIVDTYEIGGVTPEDLLRGENGALTRAKARGLDFMARVDWRVSWRFDYTTEKDLCRAGNVTTGLTVTYQLPDWDPEPEAPEGLVDYWADFESDLWVHEYGHALIGYLAKTYIQKALSEADVAEPECNDVGESLNALANAIIDRGLDADYDERTDHGRTQGAFFDLRDARRAVRRGRTRKMENQG